MASSSSSSGHWTECPPEKQALAREIVASAMAKLVRDAQADMLPDVNTSQILGIYSKESNVEMARYGCIQRAVNYHGMTAERMTDAWWRGGSAFQDLILGVPEVAETLHGEYLKRRGGLPGKANSVLPGDPPIDEQLPPVPGPPVPNEGGSSKQIMLALIQMLRAEGNEERARELEEHERSVTQMLSMMKRI